MEESQNTLFQSNNVLTDVCSKSNKKITYVGGGDAVSIQVSNIQAWSLFEQLSSVIKDIFLPRGYPESVSRDYLQYQIWDTCQAFCSSISGTLAMRAVMEGIGVGSEAATPMSAAVTWLIKDGTGMVGSIMFAWLKGSKLDSDCKKWRLFADILNDVALFLELYIPYVIKYSMHMLCLATVFKALVGTAGSSTRAALVTHQAIKGNIADVSAKDGSQEIFTNLCAFVFGIFLLKNVTETRQVWTVMCTATFFHLIFNYKAVRSLQINVFNRQRFCLTLRTYLQTSIVPSVEQINKKESVFLFKGIKDRTVCGFSIAFGDSLRNAVKTPEVSNNFSGLLSLFQDKRYIILPNLKKSKLYITFQQNFYEIDVIKAYFHACLLAISLNYLLQRKNLRVVSRCRKHSPIYRLRNILSELLGEEVEDTSDKKSKILLLAYTACEGFIEKEFTAFCNTCEDEEWDISRHLIPINDWRAEWKPSGRKRTNLSFRLPPGDKTVKATKTTKGPNRMQVLIIS